MSGCILCPRQCGAHRSQGELGVCGETGDMRIARAALYPFEEPPISGTRGSGTVFFCGCPLRCVYCQNKSISRGMQAGQPITPHELALLFLSLQAQGAHNINLVTPTHFADGIVAALTEAKPRLSIPVVYNTSGYERVETLRMLEGLVEIYMPDFKYASAELGRNYSAAGDYPRVAEAALVEMHRQVGAVVVGEDGLMKRGLLVRHLVLPGGRKDSIALLEHLADLLPPKEILLSLMSQYTPEFAMDTPYPELHRRVTTFEYETVMSRAVALGFEGFMQGRASATSVYTPTFSE